jgi:predicted metal-dependent hydrolase
MVSRLERSEQRRAPSDDDLLGRARELSDRYLGGIAVPESVRWVDNQSSRWGSCTPGDRTIRLSGRLQGMPTWVIDYVLVHELAHLIEVHHNDSFWAWVDRYPQAEKAKGYLMGWSAAARLEDPPGAEVD